MAEEPVRDGGRSDSKKPGAGDGRNTQLGAPRYAGNTRATGYRDSARPLESLEAGLGLIRLGEPWLDRQRSTVCIGGSILPSLALP